MQNETTLEELIISISQAVREAYEMGRRDAVAGVEPLTQHKVRRTATGRAAPGSIKELARVALQAHPHGVSERQMRRDRPDINRPSLQMAFRSLVHDGEAEQIGPAYYRKAKAGVKA